MQPADDGDDEAVDGDEAAEELISYHSSSSEADIQAPAATSGPSALQRLWPWHAKLLHQLGEVGMQQPSVMQAQIIPQLMTGMDAMVEEKAGMGKTTSHVLVALQRLATLHRWSQALHCQFPPALRAQVRTVCLCSLRPESPLALLPAALLIAVLEQLESRLDGAFVALAPTREAAAATHGEFERLSRQMEGVRIARAGGSPPSPSLQLRHGLSAASLPASSARARLDAHKSDSAGRAPPAAVAGEAGPSSAVDADEVAHREACVCPVCQLARPNIVVGTPTAVREALGAGTLRLARVRMVVLDEVVGHWGHDDCRQDHCGSVRSTLLQIIGRTPRAEVQVLVIANPANGVPWGDAAAEAHFMPDDRLWGAWRFGSSPRGGWCTRAPTTAAAGS